MAVGEVFLHPCFAEEQARVNLMSLIKNKEGWDAADVSILQKGLCRVGIWSTPNFCPV